MLYDNGGLGAPRRTPMPMPSAGYTTKPKMPAPPLLPQQPNGKIAPPSKIGQFTKQPLAIQQLLQAQGLAGRIPVLRGANRQAAGQPAVQSPVRLPINIGGWNQMPYQQPPRTQYRLPVAGGMMSGQSMGYRPINQNQQRDASGNMPGDWDYRPPQYGNPFMPMVPY